MRAFRKLNAKGFSHDIIIVFFVVIFAIVGVGYLVASHADTTAYTSSNQFGSFQYVLGAGTTAPITHTNINQLWLRFNPLQTGYHPSDVAMYQLNLPASTTATSITMNVTYVNGGYDTAFLAADSPTNYVWKVDTAASQDNQNVTVNFPSHPSVIYFGIKATGSDGGVSGTFPDIRNLVVHSYMLKGITTVNPPSTPAPTVKLTASPTTTSSGGSSTLSWSSTNATSCKAISPAGWTASTATSSSQSVKPSAATTYSISCTGSGGTINSSATVTVGSGGSAGGTGGSGGGNGTITFNGTFSPSDLTGSGPNYHNVYGGTLTYITASQVQAVTRYAGPTDAITHFNPTTQTSKHVRVDLCTGGPTGGCGYTGAGQVYKRGVASCTTIPFYFPQASIPNIGPWYQIAEMKSSTGDSPDVGQWGMYVNNGSGPQWVVAAQNHTIYSGPVPSGRTWHTGSICTDNSSTVYGVWLDGKRLSMNGSGCSGSGPCHITVWPSGQATQPLDINAYTGYSSAPGGADMYHGAPLIATIGSNGLPPMPAGGWNSP